MTSSGTSRGSVSSCWAGGRERERMQPPVPYREGPLDYEPPLFCDYKVKAARWISWSPSNPERRYFTCYNARFGGCDFWEWHDPESDPYWKQLLLDLRNAVWTAREEINGLKAHLQDSRNEALKNRAVSRSKESNELESLRAALEQIEATNCVLVDRITQQQKCMNMLMYALAFVVVVLVGAMSILGHNMPSEDLLTFNFFLDCSTATIPAVADVLFADALGEVLVCATVLVFATFLGEVLVFATFLGEVLVFAIVLGEALALVDVDALAICCIRTK
uniref:Zinc finger GRF-type domain-containing protein n=1 Tax=Oryza nivara TaxID=4536 RepID=A0A0E0JAK4_ORYNI